MQMFVGFGNSLELKAGNPRNHTEAESPNDSSVYTTHSAGCVSSHHLSRCERLFDRRELACQGAANPGHQEYVCPCEKHPNIRGLCVKGSHHIPEVPGDVLIHSSHS